MEKLSFLIEELCQNCLKIIKINKSELLKFLKNRYKIFKTKKFSFMQQKNIIKG